jgi:hypothetical protein
LSAVSLASPAKTALNNPLKGTQITQVLFFLQMAKALRPRFARLQRL